MFKKLLLRKLIACVFILLIFQLIGPTFYLLNSIKYFVTFDQTEYFWFLWLGLEKFRSIGCHQKKDYKVQIISSPSFFSCFFLKSSSKVFLIALYYYCCFFCLFFSITFVFVLLLQRSFLLYFVVFQDLYRVDFRVLMGLMLSNYQIHECHL